MSTKTLGAILAGAALAVGAWAWTPLGASAQQQMGPAGQGMMGSGGMMGGQQPQGGSGQGMMGGPTQQGTQAAGPGPATGAGTVGPRRRPGATRGARGTGRAAGLAERPLISEMLSLQEELGLSAAQVQRLQGLRSRFEKEAIRQRAEIQATEVDLSDLLAASRPDLKKIEAQVTKIATLTGKLRFARIKTLEEGRAVLSQEQWQKFESMALGFAPMGPYAGPWQQGRLGPGPYGAYGMMGPGMMGGYGGPGGMMGYGGGMMGGYGGPGGMMGGAPYGGYGKRQFASNGEQIYYTGVSQKNGPVPRIGGPPWVQHVGVGCVACHGVQGRGGVPVMMGTATPEDIRYTVLTASEQQKEGGKKEEMDHPPFTDATIKQAITQGVDPANKPLDWTMPRWQMADQDLNDVLEYLKSLR